MDCVNQNLTESQKAIVAALKDKSICEYKDFLIRLFKGHKDNYQLILEKITLIGLIEDFDIEDSLFISQFYNNLLINK